MAGCLSYDHISYIFNQGGFARVYEVKDRNGSRQAIKVVTKKSLQTRKAKTKASTLAPSPTRMIADSGWRS